MFQKSQKAWMDGKLIPWDKAHVHVLTHSLHYGVGVFEGIRYYECGEHGSAVFRLADHMQRFENSAKILAMKLPYSVSELMEACKTVIRENGLKEGYLRPLAFLSEGPNVGLWAYDNPVRVAILTWGWGTYLGEEGVSRGIRAQTSSFTRHHPNIGMTNAKVTGQYFNSVLAKREAKIAGFDEAIMLDPDGYVAEGTGENIFLIYKGVVQTPTPDSILPGLTRDTAMTLLKDEGLTIKEMRLTRDDFYIADEVFLTGTAAEITPVREIDTRTIGEGTPGPITVKLKKMYENLVRGQLSKYKNWLTFIER